MIVIILFFFEVAKALMIGIPVGLGIYVVLRLLTPFAIWKKIVAAFIPIAMASLAAFIWPFIDLSIRFDDWAQAEEEICKKQVSFELNPNLPRERVALYGSNIENYSQGISEKTSNFDRLVYMNIDSLAVYDRPVPERQVRVGYPLDGIDGRWKELWLAEKGDPHCRNFEEWGRQNVNLYESVVRLQEKNGLHNKCVAIAVIEDESTINFIATKKTKRKVYSKPGFSTFLVDVEVYNERTGEALAHLTTIESGWPRFPGTFQTKFVGKAGKCQKLNEFRERGIDSTLSADIFRKDFK